jgi:hypothetical protein
VHILAFAGVSSTYRQHWSKYPSVSMGLMSYRPFQSEPDLFFYSVYISRLSGCQALHQLADIRWCFAGVYDEVDVVCHQAIAKHYLKQLFT